MIQHDEYETNAKVNVSFVDGCITAMLFVGEPDFDTCPSKIISEPKVRAMLG